MKIKEKYIVTHNRFLDWLRYINVIKSHVVYEASDNENITDDYTTYKTEKYSKLYTDVFNV